MTAQVRRLEEAQEIKARKLRAGAAARPAVSQEPWLSKPSIAEYYDVTPRTIDYWCRQGMPFHQKGGRRKFKVSECEAWHESRD